MTVRRFRVVGDVPDGFRDKYRARLREYAFEEPPQGAGKEEVEGWVEVHNLLDADFSDFNRWLYNDLAVFALRVDKKVLPAKLFQAHLAKRCDGWREQNDAERCPPAVRRALQEELEAEWLKRTLPRVTVYECCWNLGQGWLLLHSLSETAADRFRKRFHRTFGLELAPWSPLDWLPDDADVADRLLASTPATSAAEVA
jgi:DNA recombination-dependent growth factor C